jgi:molybdopterin-guanine dinucleotide biosynthesis protein A
MSFSAVLLAGGESRRMQRDKATLVFGEKPLWQHQLDTLRELKPTEIFVSARTDPEWRPGDVRFVADDPPSRGPLSGIVSALVETKITHLIVLAIDMPFMSSGFLKSLCAGIETTGVIPQISDRFEPLAAIYPRDAYVDLAAALHANELSLQVIARRLVEDGKLRIHQVAEADRDLFRNLNEPADLVTS